MCIPASHWISSGKKRLTKCRCRTIFLMSQKYDTNGIIELIRPFRKNTLSIRKRISGADYDTFTIRQC